MFSRILVYRGPSRYNGAPVVAWLTMHSRNAKTGNMVTLWIVAEDGKTSEAACGTCPQKGRACYAEGTPSIAARSSLKAIRRGSAGTLDGTSWTVAEWRMVLGKVTLRDAGWGDSSALPLDVIGKLHKAAGSVRAYTHDASRVLPRAMLSTESRAGYEAGRAMGVRVAAVLPADCGLPGGMPIPEGMVMCPAIATDGKVGCDRCTLCSGMDRPTAPHVGFRAHGPRWKAADALARQGWNWN